MKIGIIGSGKIGATAAGQLELHLNTIEDALYIASIGKVDVRTYQIMIITYSSLQI
jgi:malate/lactate dehydrogenase